MPTNGTMRSPIRCATRSGMAAALASSARRASVSRRSRSLRSSASRFSASRDRSCCNIVEPVFSSADAMLEDNVVPSVDDDGDDVDVVDAVVSIDVDDDAFDFCVDAGLSPNPLPAAERVVVIVLHDDDAIVGRLDTALLLLGEKCEVVKALVRMIPWLLL